MSLSTIRGYIKSSHRDGREMTNYGEVMDYVRKRRAALGIGE